MTEILDQPDDEAASAFEAADVGASLDETDGSEAASDGEVERVRHAGRWILAVLAVALIAVLVASNVVLWRRSTQASDDLARLRRQVSNFSVDLSCNPFGSGGGSGAAQELCSRIADAESAAQDAYSHADDVSSSVEEVASCVNVYMETIARWSSNVNSRYTYKRC